MKTKNILITLAFLAAAPFLFSQTGYPEGVSIENSRSERQGDRLSVAMDIVLDGLKMRSNDMIVLTPVLVFNSGEAEAELSPVVVAGKRRSKVLQRAIRLNNPTGIEGEPYDIVRRRNNTSQQVEYVADLPLAAWMRDASLVLRESVTGCANCDKGEELLTLVPRVIPGAYVPSYKLTYIVPEAEVKTLSDRHTATFNFVVDRWELLRDYKDNAPKFNEVDRIISDIRDNPDFEITEFEIHGYASPEASVPHNRMLAENRAKAFADYLVSKFGIERNRFTVTGHGEDWVGLRQAVAASSLGDRQAVLDIIDNVANPDARDAELMKLSGGETYRTLLNSYYPRLRRTEYVVAYNVRGFDVEEAREVIKSNPRLLSLNEMYLVGQSYPAGSTEFKEVFDIAARHYPDSDIAILNSASADIEGGNMDAAIERMSKMLDKITLVRRDGNNAINDILKVVKAERSTKLRASGPSVTGLWTLTFQMPSDANIASLSTLVEDATGSVTGTAGPYLFALAIENSIDTNEDPEDRYVVSDFGVNIDATPKTPIYNNANLNNLEFSVGTGTTFTSYKRIKNRYATSENGVTVPVDQMWNTGVWNTTAPTTVNDPADNRLGLPFYPVEVGKTFSVKLDATIADKVYAYYVVLDEDYALESAPSEWNAWSAYNYEGLNQVYMADETAALKINSTSAIGDFIGFRVVVVNQDGTLVDPDGKSFYVTVGAQSSSWNAVNTVVTALNPNELIPTATKSAEVNVTLSAVTGANNFTWTTDAAQNAVAPAFDVFFLDANDNILFGTDGTGAVTANFANVKKVYTVATVNNWLQYTDNKVYNGTLTINNANGNVLRTLNVSFKKVLPTGAPEGFSVKTNQIATDGVYYSYLVPDDWTAPNATQGTMPLNQVFNFGTGLLANYQTTFAASAMSGANLVSTVVTGANILSVAKEFVDNTTQHATTVAYNYGLISTATPTVDYKVTILGFPTVFSNIYNHTYSWRWATRADLGLAATDPLPYSTSIEYGDTQQFDLADIFGVSTRDSQYNAFLDAPYLASLQVISAKLVSNANGLDEYFDVTPDPLAGATVFTLTQKSGSTNPTADVASTLVLTAKDMYDNDVEIELPMTVTKR